jgi:CNT family concentrative nucleoside transporter
MQGLAGILGILALAFVFSTNRRKIRLRTVVGAVVLQFGIAVLVFNVPPATMVLQVIAEGVTELLELSEQGAVFLFGDLARADGSAGFVFAFRVLPVLIFLSALVSVLYHLRLMQVVITGLAFVLRRTLGVTGLESLAVSANIFLGQTEAPLCIKPFLAKMTRSQLSVVMTSGFATVAGSVLLGYIAMLGGDDPERQREFAMHLITASLMSAPGAFALAKILVPETEEAPDEQAAIRQMDLPAANVLDAAARGAKDGLFLALNVGAVLIAFVSLVALVDWPLGAFGTSVSEVLGMVFMPAAWAIGVPWQDADVIGGVMGLQIVATEFLAYAELAEVAGGLGETTVSDPRSITIATYALCGFCNFASIGIQLGGLGEMAPSRRGDFARLVVRAMLGGMLACWMTASIAGLFI